MALRKMNKMGGPACIIIQEISPEVKALKASGSRIKRKL